MHSARHHATLYAQRSAQQLRGLQRLSLKDENEFGTAASTVARYAGKRLSDAGDASGTKSDVHFVSSVRLPVRLQQHAIAVHLRVVHLRLVLKVIDGPSGAVGGITPATGASSDQYCFSLVVPVLPQSC
jgi:hypothetical protein